MKHTRLRLVCFIPEEHATARSKFVYRALYNKRMNLEKIFLVVAQNYFSSIISVSAFSVVTTKWRTNRSPAIHYIQADLGLNMADVDIAASSFLLRKGGKESCHLVS